MQPAIEADNTSCQTGTQSLCQDLMDELDGHRSFAHSRSDALQASGTDITDREDAGKTCFEQIGSPPH